MVLTPPNKNTPNKALMPSFGSGKDTYNILVEIRGILYFRGANLGILSLSAEGGLPLDPGLVIVILGQVDNFVNVANCRVRKMCI